MMFVHYGSLNDKSKVSKSYCQGRTLGQQKTAAWTVVALETTKVVTLAEGMKGRVCCLREE